jgi:hypothetical protein
MGNKFGMGGNLNNASRPLRHNGATACSLLLIMSIIPALPPSPACDLWPQNCTGTHKAQSASVLLARRGGDEIKSQWLVTFLANDWHLAAWRETTLRVPHHHTADRRRHISFPARWCALCRQRMQDNPVLPSQLHPALDFRSSLITEENLFQSKTCFKPWREDKRKQP